MEVAMTDRPTRVLLTGATGFIGGRLLPALDAAGFAVRCLVRPGERPCQADGAAVRRQYTVRGIVGLLLGDA